MLGIFACFFGMVSYFFLQIVSVALDLRVITLISLNKDNQNGWWDVQRAESVGTAGGRPCHEIFSQAIYKFFSILA